MMRFLQFCENGLIVYGHIFLIIAVVKTYAKIFAFLILSYYSKNPLIP